MAQVELVMPKMGESIIEATILKWVKQEGDVVEEDETILEIATDKVDSEVPSPNAGKITKILFQEDDVVEIGSVIALIETEVEAEVQHNPAPVIEATSTVPNSPTHPSPTSVTNPTPAAATARSDSKGRFYSPLVRNIAAQENISMLELEQITGTGVQGRVTKRDILSYVESRNSNGSTIVVQQPSVRATPMPTQSVNAPSLPPMAKSMPKPAVSTEANVELIEMDRMRRLIADHMVMSKQTSPHVTSFVEADVTNIVNWRNKVKHEFQSKYGEKITFTPIFMEAVTKAIRDFPMVNVSVDGTTIIKKNDINIGMATALPSGNLIVPVIKNADHKNLLGLTKAVNDLAGRARENKLKPEEIQDGTFTLTNVGTFGNVMGTPIINQPQAAILAVGAIRKKPAVVETEYGDLIAVRQMMFLSLSYDHRVVDGFLGGSFLRRVADYLEGFDGQRGI